MELVMPEDARLSSFPYLLELTAWLDQNFTENCNPNSLKKEDAVISK